MKHIIAHIISFFLGVAVSAAGFTMLFPQVDPQVDENQMKTPPSQQAGQMPAKQGGPGGTHNGSGERDNYGQGGHNSQPHPNNSKPDFTPQDMPPPGHNSAPPPGR